MLITVLIIVLILVILFREELRTLIGLSILAFFAYGFWESGYFGKIVSLLLLILPLAGVVAGISYSIKHKKKGGRETSEREDTLVKAFMFMRNNSKDKNIKYPFWGYIIAYSFACIFVGYLVKNILDLFHIM